MKPTSKSTMTGGRSAFTLIELLVVIAIIAILMALLAAAIMKMLNVPPYKNTQLLIQKLTQSLDQQWAATIDQAKTEAIPPAIWAQAMAQSNNDNAKAMDLYVQWRLQQEFPMTVNNPGPLGPKPLYTKVLAGAPAGTPAESSVCLYVALTVGRRGMNFDSSGLSPKELRSVGGGFKALYDGWDQPIRFQTLQDPNTQAFKFLIYSTGPNRQDEQGNGDDISSDNLRVGK